MSTGTGIGAPPMQPELAVLLLNLGVLAVAYLIVFPRFAGGNFTRLAVNDVLATGVVLVIVGSVFWGTGTPFDMGPFTLNWFWFALLSYLLMEVPWMLWYFRRHHLSPPG